MKISKLHVTQYRCFDDLHLDNLGRFVCLVGPNGSGKSSVLDLISFICGTKEPFETFEFNEWNSSSEGKKLEVIVSFTKDEIDSWEPFKRNLTLRDMKSNETQSFRLMSITHSAFGPKKNVFDIIRNFVRRHVVAYLSNRSFKLEDYGAPTVKGSMADVYRDYSTVNFQQRAILLSSLMTRLLGQQRANLAKDIQTWKENKESFNPASYEELSSVNEVFERFFKITGKKFNSPTIASDGRVAYSFTIPWSKKRLPLSTLSSGEQWLLLFFVEMSLNKWKNEIVLIDEIETHLHPKLAIAFLKALDESEDDNQYLITTHSPSIAHFMGNSTIGFVLNNQYKVDVVPGNSIELLSSLAGYEGVIPVSKNLVLLEGSKVEFKTHSVDETFFEEIKKIGLIPENIDFKSIGTSTSVVNMNKSLPQLMQELGAGWNVHAIRDRDAMPDDLRKKLIEEQEGRLWIWQRGSLEGYLVEPEIITKLMASEDFEEIPSIDEIEQHIREHLQNNKNRIIERYENQVIFSTFPPRGHSTCTWLGGMGDLRNDAETKINEFRHLVDNWLNDGNWRELLPYADCKQLFVKIYGSFLKRGFDKTKYVAEIIRKIMRDVLQLMLEYEDDKLTVLEHLWGDVAYVIRGLRNGTNFHE